MVSGRDYPFNTRPRIYGLLCIQGFLGYHRSPYGVDTFRSSGLATLPIRMISNVDCNPEPRLRVGKTLVSIPRYHIVDYRGLPVVP
jgi:hypothetical protein